MKAIAFNGSSRKKHNTATLLQKALDGTADKGATTEMIHLHDFTFKGCISCFSCKKINGKSYGKCIIKDEMTPLLEKVTEADIIFLGSPIYLGAESSHFRAFFERLIYPYRPYSTDITTLFPRNIKVGIIHTMGVIDSNIPSQGYDSIFSRTQRYASSIFGHAEHIYATDTTLFDDASKYFCPSKDIQAIEKRHKEIFPKECEKAFMMGQKFATD